MADQTTPAPVGLKHRRITLQFQLGEGSFGETGANTVLVKGLRVSCLVNKVGLAGMTTADIRVYGLPPSVVRSISTLGKTLTGVKKNLVKVLAGDDDGVAVVFIGIIQTAFQDYNNAPEVSVTIGAYEGILDAVRPLPPSSFEGSADVAVILAGLAQQMGYQFQNNGVSVQLAHPYYAGSGRDQAVRAAEDANIDMVIDDGVLAIWPKDSHRQGTAVVLSPTTGMVGYPAWMEASIVVKALYNPNFVFGCPVRIKDSAVQNANGQWKIFKLTHELESEEPDGKWFTTMECSILDFTATP